MAKAEGRAELGVRFGPTARQYIDLFSPNGGAADAPLALFIHGGYWRSLDPSMFSHLARGMNAHGVTVAVSGYDLVPQVSIARHHRRRCAGGVPLSLEAIRQAHHGQRPFGRRASRRPA